MSLVPWEFLAPAAAGASSSVLRLPKLLKLLRLIKILKLVRSSRVVNRLEQNIGMKNGVFRLLKVREDRVEFFSPLPYFFKPLH